MTTLPTIRKDYDEIARTGFDCVEILFLVTKFYAPFMKEITSRLG